MIFIIVCFSGCKRTINDNSIIKNFKFSYSIAGKEMTLTTDILFPKIMLLLTDTAIAVTEKRDEYTLRILKTGIDSIYLADKLGRIGQGPGDMISSINSIQKDNHNLIEGIWLADIQSMKFFRYKPNSYILENNPVDVKKMSSQVFPCNKSFMLKNSDMLGISSSINNQIFIYSGENNALQGYDFYPIYPNPYDYLVSKTVYSAYLGLKPDKSHFVLAYQWFQSLCIVSLDKLSEPVYIKFKDTPFPQFNSTDQRANIEIIKNLPLQYINLYTTDNHIYVLYAGKKGDELEVHSREALSKGVSIHVFNWDGTALCMLNLDRIINCFCVDEKNKIIYGIDPTGENNSILYKFDIPEFK
ncbi:MAG: TolB-like 6-bladed beta-propeller domain-containing protein [Bacteroidales bacterium]|nr:TolB-like 6-bladed beta-propeller domain-containing protein [Bacteroidales bacterium]